MNRVEIDPGQTPPVGSKLGARWHSACGSRLSSGVRMLLLLLGALVSPLFADTWVPGHYETVTGTGWIPTWVDGHWDVQHVAGYFETQITPGHWEDQTVPGHEETVTVDGYWDSQWTDGYWSNNWVDGYTEDVWNDGHWEDVWNDGWTDEYGNWNDGSWSSNWVDGSWSTNWVDGYWDSSWVDGSWSNNWVDGYTTTTWVDGYTVPVWIAETSQEVWVDGYDVSTWVDGYWTLTWGPWSIDVWVDGHWEPTTTTTGGGGSTGGGSTGGGSTGGGSTSGGSTGGGTAGGGSTRPTPTLTYPGQTFVNQRIINLTDANVKLATITGVSGLPAPTGAITYAVTQSSANHPISGNPVGNYLTPWYSPITITASYPGDTNYAPVATSAVYEIKVVYTPSAPSGLRTVLLGDTALSFAWNPSSGEANTGVSPQFYDISFDGGVNVYTTVSNGWGSAYFNNLNPSTGYSLVVRGRDEFGNASAWSAPFTASTLASGAAPVTSSRWIDVNGDGLPDEVIDPGTLAFSHFVGETSTVDVTYTQWITDWVYVPGYTYSGGYYSDGNGRSYYVPGQYVPIWDVETVTETVPVVTPVFRFVAEGGYDYQVGRLVTRSDGTWIFTGIFSAPGAADGIHEWWPAEPWAPPAYYTFPIVLVRQSFAPGGCILNLPNIGAVTAGKSNGIVKLPNGVTVSAGNSSASITFPNGTLSVNADGTWSGMASLPTGVSIATDSSGQAVVTLPSGVTVRTGAGEVTIAGPGGVSITAGGSGISVTLPPELAKIAGIVGGAIDGVKGIIFGQSGDPTKIKVLGDDGQWHDPNDPALDPSGTQAVGTRTVRVGATDADNHAPQPTNVITFTLSVKPQGVSITRVKSDQIPGTPGSFLNALPDQSTIYVAPRVDNLVYLKVAASTIGVGNRYLIGVRNDSLLSILGNNPITAPETSVSFAGYAGDFQVVAGYDANGDSILQANEILSVFPGRVHVIAKDEYTNSFALLTGGGSAIMEWRYGVASILINSFVNDSPPVDAISTNDGSLFLSDVTHRVGMKWLDSGMAYTRRYTWSDGTSVSDDVEIDPNLLIQIKLVLDSNSVEVATYFQQHPGDTSHTFNWNYARVFYFATRSLHFAFGHVSMVGSMTVDVDKAGWQVTRITYSGSFDDVYDFDYNTAFPAPQAAAVQIGFGGIGGNAGRVVRTGVVINNSLGYDIFKYNFKIYNP